MILSKRLQAVADFVPKGCKIVDIGSDHGYLPIYLVSEEIATEAIAADIGRGPLKSAALNVQKYNLTEKIELRLGDGLKVIAPYEVDGVTICGMGGSLMCDILNQSSDVVETLQFLILAPNVGAHLVRHWAIEKDWQIVNEELIYEDEHFYPIIMLKKGKMPTLSLADEFAGPLLLKNKHELLGDYLRYWRNKELKLAAQLLAVDRQETIAKAKDLQNKWQEIEEEYQCQFHLKI